MTLSRPAVEFRLSGETVVEVRPTLELILQVEEGFGSLVLLAGRIERGEFPVADLRELLLILLKVPVRDIDGAILSRGILSLLLPVARFVNLALTGLDEISASLGAITSPK